jgi:hypothetical protein
MTCVGLHVFSWAFYGSAVAFYVCAVITLRIAKAKSDRAFAWYLKGWREEGCRPPGRIVDDLMSEPPSSKAHENRP